MSTDRHVIIAARLEQYAFGQLARDDQRDVEAHVRECPECAAELADLTAVMAAIASTTDPIAPPTHLKQRVLTTLAATPQRRSLSAPPPALARRSWTAGWLAAAAVMVIAVGALLYSVNQNRLRLAGDMQRAQADAQRAEALVADLQRRLADYAGQTDRALSILTSADMREIPLAGRNTASASAARAYWSPARGLLVVADRMPVPPPGRIYQVWVIGGGQPVSAGLLGTQGAGRGMLIAPPPAALASGMVTVAVTDEPPGGLASPTGSMHLVGSL